MSELSDTLLVSYRFPPVPGVGSKRWHKFAKEFSRAGKNLHVIHAAGFEGPLLNLPHIFQYPVTTFYPPSIVAGKSHTIAALFHRTFRRIFFPIDMAQQWHRRWFKKAEELLEKFPIKTLIASGPPCTLFYQAALFRKKHPQLKLILDYRDPWNDDIDHRYPDVQKSLYWKNTSLAWEEFAVRESDAIILVTETMKERLAKHFPDSATKMYVIHNGFDVEEYQGARWNAQNLTAQNIVYLGSLGRRNLDGGRDAAIDLLLEAIETVAEQNSAIKPHLTIYGGHYTPRAAKDAERAKKWLEEKSAAKASDIPRILSKASMGLTINAQDDAHAFGTKIFDYFAIGAPVFLISPPGELASLLKEQGNFAAGYDVHDIACELERAFSKKDLSAPDVKEFSIPHLAKKLFEIAR